MVPGVLLLICYIFTLIGAIARLGFMAIGLVIIANNPQLQQEAGGELGIGLEIILNLSLFLLSLGGLFGAIKMVKMRSWSAALTAAIMAIFPFCLCLPIGIWAVIVLSMDSVRTAFEANDRRAERGA